MRVERERSARMFTRPKGPVSLRSGIRNENIHEERKREIDPNQNSFRPTGRHGRHVNFPSGQGWSGKREVVGWMRVAGATLSLLVLRE